VTLTGTTTNVRLLEKTILIMAVKRTTAYVSEFSWSETETE
jgi:hypothetical protein